MLALCYTLRKTSIFCASLMREVVRITWSIPQIFCMWDCGAARSLEKRA